MGSSDFSEELMRIIHILVAVANGYKASILCNLVTQRRKIIKKKFTSHKYIENTSYISCKYATFYQINK